MPTLQGKPTVEDREKMRDDALIQMHPTDKKVRERVVNLLRSFELSEFGRGSADQRLEAAVQIVLISTLSEKR